MFLNVIAEHQADGRIAEVYAEEKAKMGVLMEATTCFTVRPDLLPLFTDFYEGIRKGFSLGLRNWRLITLVAAKQVPSTYCSYVYGQQLVEDLGSREAVLAVQRDYRKAGLSDREVTMLAYAEKIARDASRVTAADIEALRSAGFSDREIGDIALCAAIRAFMSRFFDATGATPEPRFVDPDPDFRDALTVGKRYPAPPGA